ncbi:MAG: outer membrane protein assembly factor BamD [Gammaproteobacteria bacterium HGW-Gammaproteobacteria-10]|jgi:outer membrane protein assembly factor BamD|nr:MAG: outer membrane protein assembly factor BamD [Gammaproteobacteria bacterium HGW-Gammaproteobacteria-3]PKM34964.1 MAG: outer membrane protein assembly factor BamD [Gammaproteobacteria bacterium HGW-Gammaproteobacteria-10]
MRLFLTHSILAFCLALSLQGCETLKGLNKDASPKDEYRDWDEEKLHTTAKEALDNGVYQKAIKLYETLETRYPFGDYAAQAQLNVAYAYYKNDDSEAALAAAERFIKIHPRNPSVDYAYYLKGLINYNRDIGFLERFLPSDSSQRDPGSGRIAYENFQELLTRFPDSKYVPDAKQRMIALRNNMAMHEVHIARFYYKRKAYIAAANRASEVVANYPRTPAVPYALKVMQKAYKKLGQMELANDAQRVYALNYPDGPPVPEFPQKTLVSKIWHFIGLEQ